VLDGPPPLISVPPHEVSRHALSGSIVPASEILGNSVSHDLAVALSLLRCAYGKGTELRVVVRPEMFTHGTTLAWLRAQIGTTDEHLCLSDGEAIRVLPGMKNHVFFYRMGQASAVEGFLRLRRRAPELLAGLASQVNTALALVPGQAKRPRTILLPLAPDGDEGLTLPFFTARHPVERDARALAGQNTVALPASQALTYTVVNDAALQSISFVVGLINQITRAYMNPVHILVIGIPPAPEPENALIPILSALCRHAFTLPSGVPPNVFLHVGGGAALPGSVFAGQSRLVAYEAETFWQRTAAFYAPFSVATLLREDESPHHRTGLSAVVQKLTGRAWEEVTLPDAKTTSLARYIW
jgi:hypothetical protein